MPKPKTIRESVHGDITLKPHELDVVNTAVFQRLHGIKQLGMAYVVYPTATHTRFEHSLGCVHVSQRIIDQLNRDDERVTDNVADKVRMAALLHDLAHIPYGHTLENELQVLSERHDESEERLGRFFAGLRQEIESGPTKDAACAIPLIEYALTVIKTVKLFDGYIKRRQQPEPDKIPLAPEEWFVADIIGNTICADLLDYARRDMRSTGLNQDYDDRIYSYFDLASDGAGVRLALRTTKEQGLRLDAVSEILHVLRIRYSLSERVLFHHTKNVASAMLGEIVAQLNPPPETYDELRDEELLPCLAGLTKGHPEEFRRGIERLIQGLQTRRLHKTIFRVGVAQQAPYQLENARHLGDDYSAPKKRRELEDRIRETFPQLGLGDVLIYSPEPQMTMKEVWVNVLVRKGDPICRPLRIEADEKQPYLPSVLADEVKALEDKYSALWSWSVFLAPDKLDFCFAVQGFLRQELNVSNDPFLQGYLDARPELETGRRVRELAQTEYEIQAAAVDLLLNNRGELEQAAASGPPEAAESIYEMAVDRARRDQHRQNRRVSRSDRPDDE